ncbi:hypothetical protein N2152v2_008556 [Parachlorella kessleri]
MKRVTLALDWTPNTNHVGFYVAKYKGFYQEHGLDVVFISAHEDGFQTLPAERIFNKECHFGIAPSETAVAAVFQEDTSAIVTLKESGIERPRELDGKRYATYGAKYEGSIVRQLIRTDGGRGDYEELALPLLGLWNTVTKGQADATWVFMGWEGVEARRRGIQLNAFRLADYGVPYGYSPLLITHPDTLWEQPSMVKAFLEASAQGHLFARHHPREAADALVDLAREEYPDLPDPLEREMVRESMEVLAEHILESQGRWGVMDCQRWDTFLDWLARNELLTTHIPPRREQGMPSYTTAPLADRRPGGIVPREDVRASALFTNAFLPQYPLSPTPSAAAGGSGGGASGATAGGTAGSTAGGAAGGRRPPPRAASPAGLPPGGGSLDLPQLSQGFPRFFSLPLPAHPSQGGQLGQQLPHRLSLDAFSAGLGSSHPTEQQQQQQRTQQPQPLPPTQQQQHSSDELLSIAGGQGSAPAPFTLPPADRHSIRTSLATLSALYRTGQPAAAAAGPATTAPAVTTPAGVAGQALTKPGPDSTVVTAGSLLAPPSPAPMAALNPSWSTRAFASGLPAQVVMQQQLQQHHHQILHAAQLVQAQEQQPVPAAEAHAAQPATDVLGPPLQWVPTSTDSRPANAWQFSGYSPPATTLPQSTAAAAGGGQANPQVDPLADPLESGALSTLPWLNSMPEAWDSPGAAWIPGEIPPGTGVLPGILPASLGGPPLVVPAPSGTVNLQRRAPASANAAAAAPAGPFGSAAAPPAAATAAAARALPGLTASGAAAGAARPSMGLAAARAAGAAEAGGQTEAASGRARGSSQGNPLAPGETSVHGAAPRPPGS